MDDVRSHRAEVALSVAEALLAAALVWAPLAIGTIHLWALGVMAGLAFAAAFAASLSRPRRLPWPLLCALLIAAWVGAQVLPLPAALQRALSPHAAELLDGAAVSSAWRSLSLDATATAREFVRAAALCAALYAASRVATNSSSAKRRLALVIVAVTGIECALAIVHKTVDTTAIYGLLPVSRPTLVLGSFGSGNHFAAYLGLGVPLALALGLRERDLVRRRLLLGVAAVAATLVVLTVSRSGLAGLAAALLALWLQTRRRDTEGALDGRWLLAAVAAIVAGGVGLVLLLDPPRAAKFLTLVSPRTIAADERLQMWRDLPALIHDYALVGVGRGAFEQILPGYRHHADAMTYTHVENGALQALVDLGLVGGTLLVVAWLGALITAARREATSLRSGRLATRSGAIAALVGITIHDCADFSLEATGGVALTAVVLLGLVTPQGERIERRRLVGPLGIGAAAIAAALGLGFALRGDLAADLARVEAAANRRAPELAPLLETALRRHPAEPWFPFIAGVDAVRHRRPAEALRHLNRALALDPGAFRPHLAIGEALLQLGRVSQAMLEYQLAWRASGGNETVLQGLVAHRKLRWIDGYERFAGDDPLAVARIADYLSRVGRGDDAVLGAQRLLGLDPGNATGLRILARHHFAAGRFAEALQAASSLPLADLEATLLRVRALDRLGRDPEADALVAADGAPRQAPELVLLVAERWLARGQAQRAITTLAELPAIHGTPGDLSRFHLLRGRALDQLGKSREALLELASAARIDPSEVTRLALGEAYERAGLMRAAWLAYREAVRSSSTPSANALAHLARLERLLSPGGAVSGTSDGNAGEGSSALPLGLPAGDEPAEE